MAEKLKIIPLGGLNEIGKNMTAYEYGGEIIVVDCGMAFPGDDMYGIDCVIPDVSYLIKNHNRLRGLFITHGHAAEKSFFTHFTFTPLPYAISISRFMGKIRRGRCQIPP